MIDINPFDPQTVVLLGALNPATIMVAFLLGRSADQWQKIPVAAFAGAFSGFLLYGWLPPSAFSVSTRWAAKPVCSSSASRQA